MVKCQKCKVPKDSTMFWKDRSRSNGLKSWCKQCLNKYEKDRLQTFDPEKRKEQLSRWNSSFYENHREKIRANQVESRLLVRYGISKDQYDSLYESQNGCCAICGKHSAEFKKSLHVDHCHKTNKIRGLLCPGCNISLGILEKTEWVEKAQGYLQSWIRSV